MAQALTETTCPCPLCGVTLSLGLASSRAEGKRHDLLAYRDRWAEVAETFEQTRSIDEAARSLSLPPDITRRILEYLCLEVCGCRRVTCVSCLDDYRSEL